jgi:hypothetical protein
LPNDFQPCHTTKLTQGTGQRATAERIPAETAVGQAPRSETPAMRNPQVAE